MKLLSAILTPKRYATNSLALSDSKLSYRRGLQIIFINQIIFKQNKICIQNIFYFQLHTSNSDQIVKSENLKKSLSNLSRVGAKIPFLEIKNPVSICCVVMKLIKLCK